MHIRTAGPEYSEKNERDKKREFYKTAIFYSILEKVSQSRDLVEPREWDMLSFGPFGKQSGNIWETSIWESICITNSVKNFQIIQALRDNLSQTCSLAPQYYIDEERES